MFAAFFGVGEVTSLVSPLWTEWAYPQGWIDAANVVLVTVLECAAAS
jgi:hypothetical protein